MGFSEEGEKEERGEEREGREEEGERSLSVCTPRTLCGPGRRQEVRPGQGLLRQGPAGSG